MSMGMGDFIKAAPESLDTNEKARMLHSQGTREEKGGSRCGVCCAYFRHLSSGELDLSRSLVGRS